MVHGAARVTRFRLWRLAAFLQDTPARPTIVQYLDLLPRAWRNGRRSRLRIWSRKGWRFKSSRAHQPLLSFGNFTVPFDSSVVSTLAGARWAGCPVGVRSEP